MEEALAVRIGHGRAGRLEPPEQGQELGVASQCRTAAPRLGGSLRMIRRISALSVVPLMKRMA